MKFFLLLTAFITIFISGCKKKTCSTALQLSVTNATPSVGSSIDITASQDSENDVYQWSGPGYPNNITNSNKITLDNIKLSQRGWYYCNKGNTDCNTSLSDSIFIDVKLLQETPPCSLTNNYVSCSNIPNVTFTSITKNFDPTFQGIALSASGSFGYPSFKVLFNSYNGTAEPLDGTYITTDRQVFDILQEPNEVSISFIYASSFYHSHPGYNAYVTHVNGKLQVAFCNIIFGTSPNPPTTCSGKMTQQ